MDVEKVFIIMSKDKILKKINQAILKGFFPGAVLLVGLDNKIVLHEAYGKADIFNDTKMQKDSLFDLASLTKPFATALAISKLVGDKKIFLDQKVGTILKYFSQNTKKDITIDMLLRHTSGLPAHRKYYKKIIKRKNPRQYLRFMLAKEPLVNKPNECQVYSDLGFMVLCWIIEFVTNKRLDHFVHEQIYSILDIDDLFFIDIQRKEKVSTLKRNKIVAFSQCPWREKIMLGEVDDDNAWAAGGIEGHAGLFGDTISVFVLCCEILNALNNKDVKAICPDIIKLMVQKKNNFEMVAGFDTPSKEKSSCGDFFSSSSIGHLGFTGTSFWIDPKTSLIVIFFTNRVHPSRLNEGIKEFRGKLHDLIFKLVF